MEKILIWWTEAVPTYRFLFILLACAAIIQLAYDFFFYLKLARWNDREEGDIVQPVSVVICAKNEERKLRELIPILMEQDHPNFEVVVVDDSSWDDSLSTLQAHQVRYKNLKVITLNEDIQRMYGKKFALTMGIKGASHDILLLTDADCVPRSKQWISLMTRPFNEEKTQVVLGCSPYQEEHGFLNKLIRFDTAQVATHYLSFALRNEPYMGVGRNLAYRKELFFTNSGFKKHMHVASGDDDLFISQVANSSNTSIVCHPDAQTISEPEKDAKSWFHQKRRHFTTAPYYRISTKILLTLWPFSFLLLWLSAGMLMVLHMDFLIVGSILGLRYIVHLATFRGSFIKIGQTKLIWWTPILEAVLWLVNPTLWIWNLLAKPRTWK